MGKEEWDGKEAEPIGAEWLANPVDYMVSRQDPVSVDDTFSFKVFKDGEPCKHPGCKNHVSHPCEGCGRKCASGVAKVPIF